MKKMEIESTAKEKWKREVGYIEEKRVNTSIKWSLYEKRWILFVRAVC